MTHAQFTLDVRTGPVTRKPGEFEILPQKGSKGVVVQVPGKSSLFRGMLAGSTSEDAGNSTEASAPFTIEGLKQMSRDKLRQECHKYNLFTEDWKRETSKASECRDALMEKFGLEGSNLSDYQQKCKESSNALDAFLKFTNVVDITSTISNFNPKNETHASSFMEQYRKKHGKGPTQSRKST